MKELVSLYPNFKGKQKLEDIPITNIIDKITKDITHLKNIQRLRELNVLGLRKSKEFDILKESLPAFTPSCVMNQGQKKMSNIQYFNNIVYIDLDGPNASVDAAKLKLNPSTLLIFKSVSGRGYGALIRVRGIVSVNTFKEQQIRLYKTLQIEYDVQALGIERGVVISYDPDAYVNLEDVALDLEGPEEKGIVWGEIGGGCIRANDTFSSDKLYFATQLPKEMYNEFGYCVIPEGYPYIRPHLFNVTVGTRNNRLLAYIYGFIWNNPHISVERLSKHVYAQNKKKCVGLTYKEIFSIVKWQMKHRDEMIPPSTLKKVFFDLDMKWTKESKMNIARIEIGKLRSTNTLTSINDAIRVLQNTPGKITQKRVADHLGIGISTVKRYWSDVKKSGI